MTLADGADAAAEQAIARLERHTAQQAQWLDEPAPDGWVAWDRHLEKLTLSEASAGYGVVADLMLERFPQMARTSEGTRNRGLAMAGPDSSSSEDYSSNRQYLLVKARGEDGTPSEAIRTLLAVESGEGDAGRRYLDARKFGRLQDVRRRISRRAQSLTLLIGGRRIPVLRDPSELPEDWEDQLVQALRDADLGQLDSDLNHGHARRSLGVWKWQDAHVSSHSIMAALRHLDFISWQAADAAEDRLGPLRPTAGFQAGPAAS